MTSFPSVSVKELPLFPLPQVVLFPSGPLPLHIFEPRYRTMVKDVMEKDHRFGVVLLDPLRRKPVAVGCTAEIIEVEKLPDGRMNILTVGRERFKILELVQEKPYIIGKVEVIDDEPGEEELDCSAAEVEQILRDVVQLSAKLMNKDMEFPEDLPTDPRELSYWVASTLYGLVLEQQQLLEMQNTGKRLHREAEILLATRRELAARTALKDAFGE